MRVLQLCQQRPMSTVELRYKLKCKMQTAVNITARMYHRGWLEKRYSATAYRNGHRAVLFALVAGKDPSTLRIGTVADVRRQGQIEAQERHAHLGTGPMVYAMAEERLFVPSRVTVGGVEFETVPLPGSRREGPSSLVGTARWGSA